MRHLVKKHEILVKIQKIKFIFFPHHWIEDKISNQQIPMSPKTNCNQPHFQGLKIIFK